MTREELLTDTLVRLADSLVDEYDILDLLALLTERAVELLGVSAAGLVLDNGQGGLQLAASTSESMEVVELFQLQSGQGPCRDCFLSGAPVVVEDLAEAQSRWPAFVPVALSRDFRAAHAVPLRLRGTKLGALGLFANSPGDLSEADAKTAQAMADMATIAILQERKAHDAQLLSGQLQHALNSRVAVEQAKGVLAQHFALSMEEAFGRLRTYARSHNRRLTDVARDVAQKTMDIGDLA